MALLTMALLTMALLTMALLTVAILTVAMSYSVLLQVLERPKPPLNAHPVTGVVSWFSSLHSQA